MRAFRLLLLPLLLVGLMGCDGQAPMDYLIRGPADEWAIKRVKRVLEGVRDYGNTTHINLQIAICLWHADIEHINNENLVAIAHDRFVAWQRAGFIYPRLKAFTIDKAERVADAGSPTFLISGKIDGRKYRMRVPTRAEITWEKAR